MARHSKIPFHLLLVFLYWQGFTLSCTTIGFAERDKLAQMEFGSQRKIKICTIREPGILDQEVLEIFEAWNEELTPYKLTAEMVPSGEMERPGFYGVDILEYLESLPLPKNCDRILYLKGRNWKDISFETLSLGIFAGIGIKLEVHGAVETRTNTRGYAKAKYISTLQLFFTSPKSTVIHEGYHLLGCGHQLFMEACYKQIQKVKAHAEDPRVETDFFPSVSSEGRKFYQRKDLNRALGLE